MKVATILQRKGTSVETVRPDATMSSVVWDLRFKGIGALVVSEDGRTVLGMISERDVVHGRERIVPAARALRSPAAP